MSLQNLKIFDAAENLNCLVRTTEKIRDRHFYCIENDFAIGKLLRNGFYWELYMLDFYKFFYIEGTDVIDVGGNMGTNTLLFDEIVSKYNCIFTFEPIYHQIIQKTLDENNISRQRVTVYPIGLSNERHEVTFSIYPWNTYCNYGATSMSKEEDLPQDRISVYQGNTSVTLDVVPLSSFNFSRRVSLIKIDVEGFEINVLKGMMSFINIHQPTIFIEIWKHKLDEFLQSQEAKELFIILKYKLAKIKNSAYFDCEVDEDDYILYHGEIPNNLFNLQLFNVLY